MKVKNKKLIIVTNRLPVGLVETDNGYEIKESTHHIATTLNSFLNKKNILKQFGVEEICWIGRANCSSKIWNDHKHQMAHLPYQMKPIFMSKQLKSGYDDGFSKSTLLPLLHYFPALAEYNEEWYDMYQNANDLFYKKVSALTKPDDMVWIHDYQLLLLPEMLRQDYKNLSIGLFLHTPFPSFEIIRLLTQRWRDNILRGMLGADLIGFQTGDYVQHFERTIQQLLEREESQTVLKTSRIDKFPTGIDYEKYNSAFNLPEVTVFRENLLENIAPKRLIVSIDKLDYAKGILNRLKGFGYLIDKFPEWQRHVTFVLVIIPSQQDLTQNRALKESIETYIDTLNDQYRTPDWLPIIYKYDAWGFEKKVGLYTAADVALITPIREGMNLAAKEFVASRRDMNGALILSDMAGSAQELKDAILAHPTDIEDIATKIRFALVMPPQEQHVRMENMQRVIAQYDVHNWGEDFLKQLEKVKINKSISRTLLMDGKTKLLQDYKNAHKRLIILDYDGTLINFRLNPYIAKPSPELMYLLKRLSYNRHNHVVIINSRTESNLEEWFSHLPITLVAEHGLSIRHRNTAHWEKQQNGKIEWKNKVKAIIEETVNRCPGSLMEEKNYTLAWHYRRVDKDTAQLRLQQLIEELTLLTHRHKLEILHNKKVIEIRPRGIDKGTVTTKLLADNDYDFVLAMGDDMTDENMFTALADIKAYTIKIGQGATSAKHRLTGPLWAVALLENIAGFNEKEIDSYFFNLTTAL